MSTLSSAKREGVLVLALNLLSMVLLLLRDVIAVRVFGVQQRLDTIYLGMMVPGLLVSLLYQPLNDFMGLRYQQLLVNRKSVTNAYLNSLIYGAASSILVLAVMGPLLPLLITKLAPHYGTQELEYLRHCLFLSAPILTLGCLVIASNVLLNALGLPLHASVANLVGPLVTAGLLFFHARVGEETSYITATLWGQAANIVLLVLLILRHTRVAEEAREFHVVRPQGQHLSQYLAAKMGNLSFYGLSTLTTVFSAGFAPGTISLVSMLNKLLAFFTALLNNLFASVIMPRLARLGFQRRSEADRQHWQLLYGVTVLGLVVVIGTIGVGPWVLPFVGDKIFRLAPALIEEFRDLVTLGLCQVPLLASLVVLGKWLVVRGQNRTLTMVSVAAILLDVLFFYLLRKELSLRALLLAPLLALVFSLGLGLVELYRSQAFERPRQVLGLLFGWAFLVGVALALA